VVSNRRLDRGAVQVLAALLCGASACSSSVTVRTDDRVFAQAQERLARTEAVVEALHPPIDERTLFMQAEGFFRYRFAQPPRGGASYLGEVAAALADFPALQSFAGGLDLTALRLRANDGAVQLWETLLARRPQTVLRPLTLYRLGWAYRSTGVSGLPRASGEEAFDTLIREARDPRLVALARTAKTVPAKDKGTAAAWSLVPGLGQFYVGERLSGGLRLTIALASLAAIVVPTYVAFERRTDLSWSRDWPLLATSVAGLVVLSVDYTTSYEDAMRGVVESNERAEAAFEAAHPDVP
jgi:hypothetical protein